MSEPGPQAAGRIVVGIDGSRSSMAALDWAAEQAVLTGSVLEVVTTWELPATIGWTMPPYDPAADAQRALDAIIEKVHGDLPALEIRSSVLEGIRPPSWSRRHKAPTSSSSAAGSWRVRRHAPRLGEPALHDERPLPSRRHPRQR